ncbi:hypothetical protein Kpol_505p16 [Vanderwaltozyma polyspora DSM 70294]|uniref:Uncharacterized protein n=1 Tax=Vanderwaltozyma polyspora (strain ATCC 22028 / DSM 70294 / BCRC 21397 / CBS 2163 / NBRC 10782 / NRRL Y-8283 / UCD 57-17) TaxID=436907 RepID=A7TNA7_VANPO|nr:uncharacterized protein Kpol_505p16 [Vanderwaltozyma polyspora DSM 70294]EDO16239.1 hypothetical protein Kpol_505p16 [Vanderwaltozyma polyspora DSM 70294]
MKISLSLKAQLNDSIIFSQKSYLKPKLRIPSTAFQFYYQVQMHDLLRNSYSTKQEILSFVDKNTHFRRFIRDEWNTLSTTRRRLYAALYFHVLKIDYSNLNEIELAKIMEIPTPAISPYMLFRSKYKEKFDLAWREENSKSEITMKNKTLKPMKSRSNNNKIFFKRTVSSSIKLEKGNNQSTSNIKPIIDFARRFDKMCKECKQVWNNDISNEQKLQVRNKWETQKIEFKRMIDKEIEYLKSTIDKITTLNPNEQKLLIGTNLNSLLNDGNKFLSYSFQKKKNHD